METLSTLTRCCLSSFLTKPPLTATRVDKPCVLIANRGEIALRAVEACRLLNIRSVAVFSTADRLMPHVMQADEAVCIGPPQSTKSYLNQDALLHVAQQRGCNFIYPGYGFLAENADFAERCAQMGLVFVGPSANAIRVMGDKARARRAAIEAGIPVVPGSTEAFSDLSSAQAEAGKIGYPLLLKASAGGGGRGMRVVEAAESFEAMFLQASTEAKEAFGNAEVYLERYFSRVRHIEVQIFGDRHNRVMHLGERDCTVQRRHQKLVEESPAVALTAGERKTLHTWSVSLAEAVEYEGAGTVEFIFDEESREAFFIEMNTRIQVEHPVTEVRVGANLVAEQLRVAMGQALSLPEEKAWQAVHAIEFRINAEDPSAGFMPRPGTVAKWEVPTGSGIRMDTFASVGTAIPPFYDSMVGKLIIYDETRDQAIEKAQQVLDQIQIEGIPTSTPFHQALVGSLAFRENRIYTRWVEQEFLPSPQG